MSGYSLATTCMGGRSKLTLEVGSRDPIRAGRRWPHSLQSSDDLHSTWITLDHF